MGKAGPGSPQLSPPHPSWESPGIWPPQVLRLQTGAQRKSQLEKHFVHPPYTGLPVGRFIGIAIPAANDNNDNYYYYYK